MNKITTILSISAFIVQLGIIGFLVRQDSKEKLVYINSAQLLNEYKGMQKARQAFQIKSKKWQSNIDSLVSDIENLIVIHEKGMPAMTKKEVVASKAGIEAKQRELMKYQEAIRNNAAAEDEKMTQNVLNEVNDFLVEFGKANDYKIILSATSAGNIVYAEESLDITSQVIDALNLQYLGQ